MPSTIVDINTAGLETNSLVTPQRPCAGRAKLTTANTNRYTPTNAVGVLPTAKIPKGARIEKVWFMASDTVTATELQLYIMDSSGVYHYCDSALQAAFTVTNTAKGTKVELTWSTADALVIAAGEGLYAGIAVGSTNGIFVHATGGAYV